MTARSPGPVLRALTRLLRLLRDAWLVLGISLVLFLGLEFAYRFQLAVKKALKPPVPMVPADHPYSGQAWLGDHRAALLQRQYSLDPYRGFWAIAQASPYLHIDRDGRRLTVQPPAAPNARVVLTLGGSAMWGITARDSFTISSQLAASLARRGLTDVIVISDAQPGFNTMQEATTFLYELSQGMRPSAVVMMNGYNDIVSAILSRRTGRTYNQDNAQMLLDRGRQEFGGQLLGLGRFSLLVERLGMMRGTPTPPDRVAADSICPLVGSYYANVQRSLIAVARERGIHVLTFLQPHHVWSGKPPSRWESTLPRDTRLAACADSIASAMAPYAGRAFFDLRGLFDRDTATVFVDFHSHVTEAANRRIAEAIADRLAPLLGAPQNQPGTR